MKHYLISFGITMALICVPAFANDCTQNCQTQCNEFTVDSAEYIECQQNCWPNCMKECIVTCTTECVEEANWDTCRDNCLINCK